MMKYEGRGEAPPHPNMNENNITYEWETEPDRDAFQRIMVGSFFNCYKDIPKEVLKVEADLKEWLSGHFSDGFFEMLKEDKNLRLVAAKVDRVPVGYALFDLGQCPQQIYISEMAVD